MHIRPTACWRKDGHSKWVESLYRRPYRYYSQKQQKTFAVGQTDILTVRGVPEGKFKVRRGWVWEGVSPSHTLEKKSRYELNGGFSYIFWSYKHRLNCFQNKSEKQKKSYCFGSGLLQNRCISKDWNSPVGCHIFLNKQNYISND